MNTKCKLFRQIFLGVMVLAAGVLSGFAHPQPQEPPAATDARAARRAQQAAPSAPAAILIARVEIARAGQMTIVRVGGSRQPNCQAMRLTNPERLVLDCAGAHLGFAQRSIASSFPPVRGVRAGQFTPDVVRVVIDVAEAVPYRVTPQQNSLTVEFDTAAAASVGGPAPRQKPREPAQTAVRVRRPDGVISSPRPAPAAVTSRTPSPKAPASPPAAFPSHVPPELEPVAWVNSFANGLLTFRAQNQALRSVLKLIGAQTGVAIYLAEGLGNEQLSVEFQNFRLDEVLRQILKDYDVFYFYGGGEGSKAPTALKAVWVYPAGRGPEFLRVSANSGTTRAKETEPLPADPDAAVRAHSIEILIRRQGRQAGAIVQAALKDESEKVRSKALYRALLAGAEIPQEILIQLALNDESANVRYLALQALPLDPNLRWVAERAVNDSSQQVSEMAQDILHELDAANQPNPAADSQRPPEK